MCHGRLRYQLWWLLLLTWRVLLVVCWLFLPGWCGLDGHATAPATEAMEWTSWVWRSRCNLPHVVMIIVCAGA
jgi:hypothetical protein